MSLNVDENDVWMVRVNYSDLNLNRAFNVLHYRVKDISVAGGGLYTSQPMWDIAPTAAMEFAEVFADNWDNTASQGVILNGVTVKSISPNPQSRAYTATLPDGGRAGTIVSEPIPLQDAVTLLKYADGGTRQDLGRIFIPGCPENGQNAGILTPEQMTLYELLCSTFSNYIEVVKGGITYTFEPVLYGEKPPGTWTVRPIREVFVSDTVLKSQRRRRPGKGI